MKLQGVGRDEFQRYGMGRIAPKQLADFCGNSHIGCKKENPNIE